MSDSVPTFPATFRLERWPSSRFAEAHGQDCRSEWAERFWLPVLWPAAFLTLRALARRIDEGVQTVDSVELAAGLALLGPGGALLRLDRAIDRLVRVHAARSDVVGLTGTLMVSCRTILPPLSSGQVDRLPPGLRAEYKASTGLTTGVR
jgi:hypothetical protein